MQLIARLIRNWHATLLILLAIGLAACGGATPDGSSTVTAITVDPETLALQVGQNQALTASVAGTGDFSRAVTWSSNDATIAAVNGAGVVTGIAAGSTTVIASSASSPLVQATVPVTVTAAQAECQQPGQVVEIPDAILRGALLRWLDAEEVTECELAKLEFLRAQNFGVASLEGLQHATGLKGLDLMMNLVTDLSPIADLKLEELKLNTNPVTDVSPKSGMTSLKVLHTGPNDGQSDLSAFSDLVNLEELYVQDTAITDLSVLERFQKLEHLAVGSFGAISPTDYAVLARLPELSTLIVHVMPAEELRQLRGIPNLTHLHLRSTQAYEDVSDVLELTQLQSLTIRLPAGTELSALSDMTDLVTLNVADSFVTDLTPLLPLMNLELVDVRRNCLPANVGEDSAYLALVDRGVWVYHDPQRSSGC